MSEVDARMLVSFFSRTMFVEVGILGILADNHAFIKRHAGADKQVPRRGLAARGADPDQRQAGPCRSPGPPGRQWLRYS